MMVAVFADPNRAVAPLGARCAWKGCPIDPEKAVVARLLAFCSEAHRAAWEARAAWPGPGPAEAALVMPQPDDVWAVEAGLVRDIAQAGVHMLVKAKIRGIVHKFTVAEAVGLQRRLRDAVAAALEKDPRAACPFHGLDGLVGCLDHTYSGCSLDEEEA